MHGLLKVPPQVLTWTRPHQNFHFVLFKPLSCKLAGVLEVMLIVVQDFIAEIPNSQFSQLQQVVLSTSGFTLKLSFSWFES